MNGSVNFSTYDGWICEFAKDGENSFIVPPAPSDATPEERDQHDLLAAYHILEDKVLPMYYGKDSKAWWKIVLNSMNDVVPFFDADRMADEYYTQLYDASAGGTSGNTTAAPASRGKSGSGARSPGRP